mmetsp:Transcript_5773/g.23846  ORF Transcript_5773/g.23846 Transcript_5773/m.23846 type:complete len:376 (+) Transcript_5773:64-1191(+)
MADDDVRKFDPDRTVLARGLPLATSTAKSVTSMFTTAGKVSRVAVGSEEQRDKGTFAVAAIEFAAPPNKSLLDSMEGMDVPGGHPAGLKFIDWDVKKHFKLFGKKQRGAVAEAGRAAAKVELAGASGSTEPEDRGDSPPRGDATGWAAVDPEPEPDVPVSVRLAREEEERAAQRAAAEAAAEAEDDLISLGGDESDHFDDDGDKSRSDTPEPRDDDDDVRHIKPEGHRLRDDDDDDDGCRRGSLPRAAHPGLWPRHPRRAGPVVTSRAQGAANRGAVHAGRGARGTEPGPQTAGRGSARGARGDGSGGSGFGAATARGFKGATRDVGGAGGRCGLSCEGTGKPRIRATIATQPVDHGEGVVSGWGPVRRWRGRGG